MKAGVGAVAALFVVSALLLFWLCSKRGWNKIKDTGPRWYVGPSLVGAIFTGLVIGIIVGAEAGAARTGLNVASDLGEVMLFNLIVRRATKRAKQTMES